MTTDSLNVKVTADVTHYTSQMENAKKKTTEFGDSLDKTTKETKEFEEATEQATKETKEFGETAEKATKKANDGFSSIKSTIVSLGIGSLIKTSLTDAMNAVESESLFETSMGGFAQQARDWSINLSKNLGLDEYALRKNVGTLYNMTTSMGLSKDASYELSTGLVALGEDMASFYNLSSEEAFTKLRSGLTGEIEPLRSLGILINEQTVEQYAYATGIAKTGEKLTEQQKVLARYQAILAQTTNAQGDLARTLDSPANQMRVMMNDLKTASIEFGTALMPVVQVTLPIFRQVIADIKPVAVAAAEGISVISSGLSLLESPVTRSVIYIGAATVAINKLQLAVGGTAAGLILLGGILTTILGRYSEAQKDTAETAKDVMTDANGAITSAQVGVDNLSNSYEELGRTIARTASFDELTKLSGGTSGGNAFAAQFVEAENAANSAAEAVNTYNDIVSSLQSPEIGINLKKFDWERLKTDIEKLGEDIIKVFSGTEEESYEALKSLNERVEILFGEEWTGFWEGVGGDIYGAFNDFGSEESYNSLKNLCDKIEELPFGDVFTNAFKKVGEGFFDITQGIEKLSQGDFNGALEKFSLAIEKNSDMLGYQAGGLLFGEQVGGAIGGAASWVNRYTGALSRGDEVSAAIVKDEADKATRDTLKTVDDWMVNELFGNNPLLDEFNGVAKWWSDTWQGVGASIYETFNSTNVSEITTRNTVNVPQASITSPITNADILTSLRSSAPTAAAAPIQLVNTIILDGEEMKNWTQKVQADRNDETNGRQ